MGEPLTEDDLAAIRARYQHARMAGTAADDAEQGWDDAKVRALTRSWQDVSRLHDEVLRLRRALEGRTDYPCYTCPRCHMTSYNPNDIAEGYCGNCHDWTSAPIGVRLPRHSWATRVGVRLPEGWKP